MRQVDSSYEQWFLFLFYYSLVTWLLKIYLRLAFHLFIWIIKQFWRFCMVMTLCDLQLEDLWTISSFEAGLWCCICSSGRLVTEGEFSWKWMKMKASHFVCCYTWNGSILFVFLCHSWRSYNTWNCFFSLLKQWVYVLSADGCKLPGFVLSVQEAKTFWSSEKSDLNLAARTIPRGF